MNTFHRFFLVVLSLFFINGAFAQKSYVTLTDASNKTIKKFEKAKAISLQLDTESRKSKLEDIVSKEPVLIDALVELSRIAYYKKDYESAEALLNEALEQAPDYDAEWYNVYAGICKAKEDYACEKVNLKKYVSKNISHKKRKRAMLRLDKIMQIEMIIENTDPVELEMLSYHINSEEYPEYKPVLSTNDSTIIFTRRVDGQEDFYQSELGEMGWSKAAPVNELNTMGNEGAHAISPNGKYMIFTRCDAPKRYRSCDLYISLKKDGKWSEAKYMGVTNTESWESQAAFSPDGKTVYFSSARNGNKDLYSIENKDGKWGEVTSLGDVINTNGNEESPYIHPDGRTMYFMSTGHPGLGGYDLFVSKLRPEGTWTKPMNMGASINSTEDEGGIFVDRKGKYAYFSKTEKKEDKLESDIYRFLLPPRFKPDPVTYIDLKVIDAKTKTPIKATLILKEKENGNKRILTIPTTGLTEIIQPNTNYEITIEKEKYFFYSENIDPTYKNTLDNPFVYTIELQAIPEPAKTEESEEIVLRHIYFETGKARLLSSSYEELDRLISLINEQAELKIIIFGHTDDVGSEEDNLLLSQNRAKAVKTYLTSKNILDSRIQTKALGESQPIADNNSEEGRAQNRRISFRLQ